MGEEAAVAVSSSSSPATSTTATMADILSKDLVVEILLLLPPRAVGRLRWTCKEWLVLTSEPYFIRRYRALHPSPPLVGFFINCISRFGFNPVFVSLTASHPRPSHLSIPYRPLSMLCPPEVVDSCRDLLLCCCYLHGSKYAYLVCNPSAADSGTLRIIPNLNSPGGTGVKVPCPLPPAVTYHLASDDGVDFTLIAMDWSHTFPNHFYIYSSATTPPRWRPSAATLETALEFTPYKSIRSVYLKRSMYWMDQNGMTVHALHIDTESVAAFPLPISGVRSGATYQYIHDFSVSGGCLHVSAWNMNSGRIDIWEIMNPDPSSSSSSSWTLIYSFTSSTMLDEPPLYWTDIMSMWMLLRIEGEQEEHKDMLLLHVENGPFILYNIADRTIKETQTPSKQWGRYESMKLFKYFSFSF